MNQNMPQTLKGFRDFLPAEKRKRDYVMAKIVATFESFGFEPLETPTLEYASLLLGKYGTEADRLVYTFEDKGQRQVGLRYDQTVPTARVLGQYREQLPKYFRRYQMQNVFRADKPQKGRFREFAQCDIDIFGSKSTLADAEILACTYASFVNVGFKNIQLKVNDRAVLIESLTPFTTDQCDVFSLIQSIDKLDKQTQSEVAEELVKKGLNPAVATEAIQASSQAKISASLQQIIEQSVALGVPQKAIVFEPQLARGLDYYTGLIFEVILPDYAVGSCAGGGRYDLLIGQLSGQDVPAVGTALGFDRLVEAADQLGLIADEGLGTQVLVSIVDEQSLETSAQLASQLRSVGISTELFPDSAELGKQFKYADQKKIPFVAILGEKEQAEGKISLKNMTTGEQELLSFDQLVKRL